MNHVLMPWWLVLFIDWSTTFTITAGGALNAVMASGTPINRNTIIVSCLAGFVTSAMQLRARMSLPPIRTNGSSEVKNN